MIGKKEPILIGELIQQDKFAPPIKMVLSKTWFERLKEFLAILIAVGSCIGIGWMLNELIRGVYGCG